MGETIGVEEASKILGLSKKSVYTRLRAGKLPGKKVKTKHGRKWMIDRHALEEHIQHETDVVEVKTINRLVNKEELMEELIGAINRSNAQMIAKIMETLGHKLHQQDERITTLSETIDELKNRLEKRP